MIDYGFNPAGQVTSAVDSANGINYALGAGYAPNSNVLTANDSVNANWTYGYDEFNRLIRATPAGQTYWYTYEYDRFGNRWHQSLGGTGGPPGNVVDLAFDANNRTAGSGVSYDAAGNVTNDGDSSYTYDAENRIITVSGSKGTGTYVYNAAGLRIRKTTPSGSVDYLYDLAGHVVTEVNASGAWTRVEVYAGSRHIATYKDGPAGQTYFSHADWLGTERTRTGMTGTTPVETCTSLPFGDGQTCTGTNVSPLHFTGKERDSESDSDYFGARYYISRHGRWLTPDWSARQEAVPYADLANPQTLNLYAYVGNNPVSRADEDGHSTVPLTGVWWKGETLAVAAGSSSGEVLPDMAAPLEEAKDGQSQPEQTPQNIPAPTTPEGQPAPPPVPPPPDKQGQPNTWQPTPGTGPRGGTKWVPQRPVPSLDGKGGQPQATWDPRRGHWDIDNGVGKRDRYLPDGTKVDHWNNPIPRSVVSPSRQQVQNAAKAVSWGIVIYLTVRTILRIVVPATNLVPAP